MWRASQQAEQADPKTNVTALTHTDVFPGPRDVLTYTPVVTETS